jgi:hypothetical protein
MAVIQSEAVGLCVCAKDPEATEWLLDDAGPIESVALPPRDPSLRAGPSRVPRAG